MKLSRVLELLVMGVLVPMVSVAAGPTTFGANPWNVLLVTADDMNADSSGWMGNPLKATPNLDAFAATAHRFVNNHVSAPICQPSRSALMTGRVPHRSGALGFHPIHAGVPTMVSQLQNAGWHTSVIDKHPHMKPDVEFPWDIKLGGSGKNPRLFGEHVAACIAAAKEAGKPFFLNANITDPHRPFAGSSKKNQKAQAGKIGEGDAIRVKPNEVTVPAFLEDIAPVRSEVAEYFTSIRRLDASFGELMKALDASGQKDSTVVLFMSDHGMSFPFSKATVYRNGTWSPLLVRWPGMGDSQTRQEFVSSLDVLPAVLELLGQPALEGIDGRSWLPLLNGQTQPDRDYVITHVNSVSSGKSFPQRCIRTAEFSYQFHAWPDGSPQFKVEAMSGKSYAAMELAAKQDPKIRSRVDQLVIGVKEQFFDLCTDADERVNVIHDPNHADTIRRLKKLLLAHMVKTDDPQLGNFRDTAYYVARPLTEKGAFTLGIEGPACDSMGNIFAVNFSKQQTIGKVTPDGKAQKFLALPGDSVGNGIRFDPQGNMYVADYVNHNVLKFDFQSNMLSVFSHQSRMNQPNDLAIAEDGTLYASDPNWSDSTGQLWRIDRDGGTHLLATDMGTTNGIDISPDGKKLYVNESVQRNVWVFDITAEKELANKRLLIQFPDFGFDGMRVDVDGNLYITRHGKGTVVKVSPSGEILREIDVLGKKPSNICFGGPDGCTAYVTEVEHTRLIQFQVERPGLEWQRNHK